MSDTIQDRNERFNDLAALMRDLSDMTGVIKEQTQIQGGKLQTVDNELGDAAENVEQANEQLEQKVTRERAGNKCLIWCVVVAVIVVILLIYLSFVRKDDEVIIVEVEKEQSNLESDPTTPLDDYTLPIDQ